MDFPKYKKTNKTAREGINWITSIIESEFNWIFRTVNQEDDFGIDGFFDIITDEGYVTGQSFAVQIKTGQSYLNKRENHILFKGDTKHINYYLNNQLPVLIIIVDLDNEMAYWEVCNKDIIDIRESHWELLIPTSQILIFEQKRNLEKHLNPVYDYVTHIKNRSEDFTDKSDLFSLLISNSSVVNFEYSALIDFLAYACENKKRLMKMRGSVNLYLDGYDNDDRELYEIPETRKWISLILEHVPGLSFFLSKENYSDFLRLYFLCSAQIQVHDGLHAHNGSNRKKIDVNLEDFDNTLSIIFNDLNEFSEAFNLTEKLIEEISDEITTYITNGEYKK